MALAFLQDNPKVARSGPFLDQFRYERRQHPLSGAHISSFFGLEKILRYQLTNGAEADIKGPGNWTPLSVAVQNGREAVVELLIARKDVDVNSKDYLDRSSLWYAVAYGHEAVVRLLLARPEIEVNHPSPLRLAAEKGHEAVVRLLLARPEIEVNLGGGDPHRSPLSWAVVNGHEAVVSLLLERADVEVNSKRDRLDSPLFLARRSRTRGMQTQRTFGST